MAGIQTIEKDEEGKYKIKQVKSISAVYPIIPENADIQECLTLIETRVKKDAETVKAKIDQNAFNNVRGEWFELFLNARFYNFSKENLQYCIFSIPPVSSAPFIDFFDQEVRQRLDELEANLQRQDIELKMSNPDFLCVDLSKVDKETTRAALAHEKIYSFDEKNAEFLNGLHRIFLGKCSFDAIKFAISAKTSVRPDRRYQFVHEGNIIKALTAHLQTRFWRTDAEIKYYALTNEQPKKMDIEVLKTAAISSITNVFAKSVRAVDEIFWIKELKDIDLFLKMVLTKK